MPPYAWIILLSGLCWITVYLAMVHRGFRDRATAMPLPALATNFSWELIYAFVKPHPVPQLWIDYAWVGLDALLVVQFLRFGRAQLDGLPFGHPAIALVLAMAVALPFQLLMGPQFGDVKGTFSAFFANLLMSICFVGLLAKRGDGRGQSRLVAALKLLGTLLASVYTYLTEPGTPLLTFCYVAIFGFDLLYLAMLHERVRAGRGA